MGTGIEQRAGQPAGSGSNLDRGAGADIAGGADNARAQIEVEQEMLAKRLVGIQAVTRDHIAQRSERAGHARAAARRRAISSAMRMAAMRLVGSAIPWAAISSAV